MIIFKRKEIIMTVDLKRYRENLEQPWGKIQYEITFA
ncbi:hypothetical protein K710_0125 [Streptococcus iniae SF1]|nr:hypothetical protein K710_0125 [Streptococcus iniae SF1]